MSRIGKLPVEIPSGVEVTIEGQKVTAKGPLGTESVTIRPEIKLEKQDNHIILPCATSREVLVAAVNIQYSGKTDRIDMMIRKI